MSQDLLTCSLEGKTTFIRDLFLLQDQQENLHSIDCMHRLD